MKTPIRTSVDLAAARRGFLRNLVAVGGALTLAPATALADRIKGCPNHLARRFRFSAVGMGDFQYVVSDVDNWPTSDFNGLTKRQLEDFHVAFQVEMTFPYRGRDVLELQISMNGAVISYSLVEIEEITVGSEPEPTFGMMGRWLKNDDSPFGAIEGRCAFFGGSFDREGDNTTFRLLGGSCTGSHATFVREATGSIHFHGFRC